ncbi:MAG: tetratricopeptide repeat protein [Promethearchaeati archaeon]
MKISKLELIDKVKYAKDALLEKENTKAAQILEELLQDDPINDHLWLLFGIVKRRMNEFEKAISCFETAIELNPSLEEAWGLLTITYLDINDKKQAENVMKKALELNPYNNKIQFYQENLINVYLKFGSFFDKFDNVA